MTRDVSEHRRHADELEQARAEAEALTSSKGRFLATVSHELRTPLNAIIGFSEMLAAEGALAIEPERRREYAQIVHESGQHLLGIVNTLLDISKIETGNFKLVPEPFDPGALLQSNWCASCSSGPSNPGSRSPARRPGTCPRSSPTAAPAGRSSSTCSRTQ